MIRVLLYIVFFFLSVSAIACLLVDPIMFALLGLSAFLVYSFIQALKK